MSVRVTASSSVHRERLAMRLLQNWTALHPDDKTTVSFPPSTTPLTPTIIGIRHVPRMRTGGFAHQTYVASVPPSQQQQKQQQPSVGNPSSSPGGISVSSDQNIDDSLTSLSWLQNLNVMKLAASAASAASSTGQSRSSGSTTGVISTSGSQYQHQASRPTGAVQPIQIQQPRRSLSSTSSLSSCSVQRLGVDPNEVLDMSYLNEVSCKTLKVEREMACESPIADVTVRTASGRNNSPLLPPRLSPQPPAPNSDSGSSCGSVGPDGRPSPSPPALQLAACGVTGSGVVSAAKPGHSYATLICMAMNDAVENRVTLAGIYTWIVENFPYYQTADPSWQNSIRHNLSLNKCFQRVQRDKSDPPGKGSYWTFNPDFQQLVDRDLFRKRDAIVSGSVSHNPSPAKKVCRRSAQFDEHRPHSKQHQQQRTGSHSRRTQQHHMTDCKPQSIAVMRRTSTGHENEFSFDEDADKSDMSEFTPQSIADTDFDGSFDLADALDMSWSAILGRDIDEQRQQQALQPQRQGQSLLHRPTSATSSSSSIGNVSGSGHRNTSSRTTGSTGSASHDDEDELDELIRACAETDNRALETVTGVEDGSHRYAIIEGGGVVDEQTGVFEEQATEFIMSLTEDDDLLLGRHHNPLDLTIQGVGLRPPDWWNTLDIVDDFDGFVTAVSAANVANDERVSQQLPQREEAPHPWAENRDRTSGDLRHLGLGEIDDTVDRDGLSQLFENNELSSSFDAGDQLLLMTSSGETHEFDEF